MGSNARVGGVLAAVLAAATSLGCSGHRETAPPRPASAAPSATQAPSVTPSAGEPADTGAVVGSAAPGSSGAADAPASPPVASFEPARSVKACKTGTVDIAQYQQRGEIAIAGRKDRVAASWLVNLAGRRQEQVAFATFDPDAKQAARARGIGLSEHTGPRAFAVGGEWTITWFDERGFAYTHPREDPLPAPDILHLTAIGPGEDEAVTINHADQQGLVAAVVLPSNKDQVALFSFAPADPAAPGVRAFSVTHHAKGPRRPAVAADKEGVTVAWLEDGQRIAASHFDPAGKETDRACTIAPNAAAERTNLVLASTQGGSVAVWLEGDKLRARGVDGKGCPASPIFDVGQGTSPRAIATEGGVLVAWVSPQGKLVAAKLGPKGQPPDKGLEIADAPGGVKDPPAIAIAGARAAFAWTELMGPGVSTRRMVLRTVDASCLP